MTSRRVALLFLLLLSVFAWYTFQPGGSNLSPGPASAPAAGKPPVARFYLTEPPGVVNISVAPMMELDYLTKKAIYDLRRSAVLAAPGLVAPDYQPSEEVFGRITDRKPWWGIYGIYYYGRGEQGIAGPSEESRYLLNPYLLVGLEEGRLDRPSNPTPDPVSIHPELISLSWEGRAHVGRAVYDLTSYFAGYDRYRYDPGYRGLFLLTAYNARDFGLNYLYLVPEQSVGIVSENQSGQALLIENFIHTGGSCGYPGGCNNGSPYRKTMEIRIAFSPATAVVRLWKAKPASVAAAPDWTFILEFK